MKIDHPAATRPLSLANVALMAPAFEPVLNGIDSPDDLKRVPVEKLVPLCAEIRRFLLDSVSVSGGHFASSLGVVELSVALHRVFDTPHDKLIWDVGHQAYVHKILTGRRDMLGSIRKSGGLAGFPARSESRYDAFGTAHSSTSISAALGMAVAAKIADVDRRHVAIIGDGAMTGGLAYEALCNAADAGANLVVVVNDNQMSISPNVGAIPRHLQALVDRRRGPAIVRHPVADLTNSLVGNSSESSLFEVLGLPYTGPIDGHDVLLLIETLARLRDRGGVQVLHVRTRKGKGYEFAERDPIAYHGTGPFDPAIGLRSTSPKKSTFSDVFGLWACETASRDPRLVVITPAMREGSGLVDFAHHFPDRFFDVGIAEAHALTFAAGMACDSVRPVVAIYSSFLQRAYDQLVHDIALQNLPVMLAIDRAGLVGADGPTHAGTFDIAFLRPIPNLVIMTPADERECCQMLTTGLQLNGPSAVRYPRGTGPGSIPLVAAHDTVPLGRAQLRREGKRTAILAFGTLLSAALEAAERLDATVVNMRFVKPIDREMIIAMAESHDLIVTVEEGALMGGAGSAVQEIIGDLFQAGTIDRQPCVMRLGLPDSFLPHGDCAKVLAQCGLDAAGIAASIRQRMTTLM